MNIDLSVSAICRLADRLRSLKQEQLVVVVEILADLGIVCERRADGSFVVSSSIEYAKRKVVEVLTRCKGVTRHETC